MSESRTKATGGSRGVENAEQSERANPWQDIPLQDMPPPVEGAPQAVADEQQQDVPQNAGNPEATAEHQHPENPAEGGDPPNQQNEGYEERRISTRQQNEKISKEMKLCLFMVMCVIILYLTLGTAIATARKYSEQNETIAETDVNFNVTTPMTTTIFDETTIVNDNTTSSVSDMNF